LARCASRLTPRSACFRCSPAGTRRSRRHASDIRSRRRTVKGNGLRSRAARPSRAASDLCDASSPRRAKRQDLRRSVHQPAPIWARTGPFCCVYAPVWRNCDDRFSAELAMSTRACAAFGQRGIATSSAKKAGFRVATVTARPRCYARAVEMVPRERSGQARVLGLPVALALNVFGRAVWLSARRRSPPFCARPSRWWTRRRSHVS
jgi:hypothetical protein